MEKPIIEVIETNGQDTMPTMAQKINKNFQAIVEYVVKTFENCATDKVVAVDGQSEVHTTRTFLRNSHNLVVFLNGVVQIQNESYTELSNMAIRFLSPLQEGDEVYMIYNQYSRPGSFDEFYTKKEIDAMFIKLREEVGL